MNIPDQAIDAAWESILYDARADEDYAFLETIDPEIITDALAAALPHIRAQIAAEVSALELDRAQYNRHVELNGADFANGWNAAIFEATTTAEEGNTK